MTTQIWEVMVIGAGAAGLLAATHAAERGRKTLLLEKNRKPGVKILMSGGTRCNLTHATDVAGMVRELGPVGKFLRTALERFPPQQVVQYVEAEGVPTKVEETGKVFPCSDRAVDVQQALVRRLMRSSCQVQYGQAVEGLVRQEGMFVAQTGSGPILAEHVIVTTGGCSYPGCGTTGDAYAWLKELGHTILPPRPALVPLLCEVPWSRALSGLTIPDTTAHIALRAPWQQAGDVESQMHLARKRSLATRRGSLLFTHFGFSGPAVLDVSRAVTAQADPRDTLLIVDFAPQQTYEQTVQQLLSDEVRQGGHGVGRFLTQLVPQRLAQALLDREQVDRERRCAELGRATIRSLAAAIHACPFPVHGTRGFAKAEVTAGGVDLQQVDPRTMQSKCAPGLFLAGEVLDVDGPIGGFNFQAAFSTGWLAGGNA